MPILAYKINGEGYIEESFVVDDIEELGTNHVIEVLPDGLYRPKWTGEQWIEDMPQEEIDELNNQPIFLSDTEVLGQQMTEREIEAIVQGQQITDMEIRLMMMEMGAN